LGETGKGVSFSKKGSFEKEEITTKSTKYTLRAQRKERKLIGIK
jgi:hypothetical protein